MAQQTAMDLLFAETRLEMEKEQQEFFFRCGRQYQLTGEGTFNQVYNETYGNNNDEITSDGA